MTFCSPYSFFSSLFPQSNCPTPPPLVSVSGDEMKFSSSHFFAFLACSLESAHALGQNQTVSLTPGDGLLQIAGSGVNGQILVSANDWWGVLRVAEDLAGDVGKVTGRNLTLGNWMATVPGKRDLSSSDVARSALERDVLEGPQAGAPGEGGPTGGNPGGWGWGGESGKGESGTHPPGNEGHNGSVVGSSGTTVYYSFNPVASFINVSSVLFLLYHALTKNWELRIENWIRD
jgi:hypothetical protein